MGRHWALAGSALLVAAGLNAAFFSSELSTPLWGSGYDPLAFKDALLCSLLLGVPVKGAVAFLHHRYLKRVRARAAVGFVPSRARFTFGFWARDLALSIICVVGTAPILPLVFFVALQVPVVFCLLPYQLVVGPLLWPRIVAPA